MTLALVFDTETTGLWNFKDPNIKNDVTASQHPNLVQLAYRLIDLTSSKVIETVSSLVYPDYYTSIPAEASKTHGITYEDALKHGMDPMTLCELFKTNYESADVIIAHNLDYDIRIMKRFAWQNDSDLIKKPFFCTMKATTNLCQIDGPYGFKWPSLTELHQHLFSVPFEGAHDALNDVLALERCVKELFKRKLLIIKE